MKTQATEYINALVEVTVLDYLGLKIIELDTYTDEVIPDGRAYCHLYRYDRSLGPISKWGDKYHTSLIQGHIAGYPSLYAAATCWVEAIKLEQVEKDITEAIVHQRALMPDYF